MGTAATPVHSAGMTLFTDSPRPLLGGSILAEAVTFDPGLVVAVLLVVALVCIGGVAVAVIGVCAGFRSGRDPQLTRAPVAWQVCLAIEVVAVVTAHSARSLEAALATWTVLAAAIAAHFVGRAVRESHDLS